MKIKTFLIILYFFYSFNLASANENKILFKVNNKIITSIDILNEINYLNSLNRDLQSFFSNFLITLKFFS